MRPVLALAAVLSAALQSYDPFAAAKQVTVNGAALAYVEMGEGGTPVVLVHGSGADLRTWGYQLQHLAETRRTIAYSRRFHHPNAPPAGDDAYDAGQHAKDLVALVDRVIGGPADLVASSSGALVALIAAGAEPHRFRRLVLVEPVVFSMAASGTAPEAFERARQLLLDGDTEQAMRTFLATLIMPGAYELMPETTRAMLRDNLPELKAEAHAELPGLAPRFTCDDARSVGRPTLLIDGGNSAAFLREMTERIAACLPDGTRKTIPGAAHAVHAQQVQAFNHAVTEFLGGSTGSSR